MSKYPALRLAVLTTMADIKSHLAADPQFLEHEECPYDTETKDLLKELLTERVVEVTVEKVVGGANSPGRGRPSKDVKLSEEDQQAILTGIKTTLDELDAMSAVEGLETNERIQIAKTRTSLMDQLLKMQERHFSITKTQEFIETVVGILDDVVDEHGRETVLNRLDSFR